MHYFWTDRGPLGIGICRCRELEMVLLDWPHLLGRVFPFDCADAGDLWTRGVETTCDEAT